MGSFWKKVKYDQNYCHMYHIWLRYCWYYWQLWSKYLVTLVTCYVLDRWIFLLCAVVIFPGKISVKNRPIWCTVTFIMQVSAAHPWKASSLESLTFKIWVTFDTLNSTILMQSYSNPGDVLLCASHSWCLRTCVSYVISCHMDSQTQDMRKGLRCTVSLKSYNHAWYHVNQLNAVSMACGNH